MTPTNRHLADKLGDIRPEIAALEEQAAELRERILATGAVTLTGEDYLVSVRTVTRHMLNLAAVRSKLSPEDLAACTTRHTNKLVSAHPRRRD